MTTNTYVSEDRMTLVRVYQQPGSEPVVEVATREHPDGIWGPPVRVIRERLS